MKHGLLLITLLLITFGVNAQENTATIDSLKKQLNALQSHIDAMKNLEITGWIQVQYQLAESNGIKSYDGGDFAANSNSRFMIRRGRVRFMYDYKKVANFVFQLNATERGVNIMDLYSRISIPKTKAFFAYAGIMNRPYGYEIQLSSQFRESPERGRFNQMLLMNERDLGLMFSYEPQKKQKLYGLKVDAGIYNGTGIVVPGTTSLGVTGVTDFDKYKDFMGRIHYDKYFKNEKYLLGVGVSHYNGGVVYQNNRVFDAIQTDSTGNKLWSLSDTTSRSYSGKKAPRIYYGADVQFSINSSWGKTTLRGEYNFGVQPGTISSSKSPQVLPTLKDTYLRHFNAAYFYLVHRFLKSKHEAVIKYDWYDPNTKIKGTDVTASSGLTDAELRYDALGFGYSYYLTENVKFMLYYNCVRNERAKSLAGFTSDLKDDVFTFRFQLRF